MQAWLRRITTAVAMTLAVIAGLLGVMQLVPYGRTHSNPPVVEEPTWDSPRTRELAMRACFDCHSNETRWPWYSHVAPMSWVTQRDVDVGRRVINFSDWTRHYELSHASHGEVLRREMPPRKYRWLHDHAHLTEQEKMELAKGLDATLALSPRK